MKRSASLVWRVWRKYEHLSVKSVCRPQFEPRVSLTLPITVSLCRIIPICRISLSSTDVNYAVLCTYFDVPYLLFTCYSRRRVGQIMKTQGLIDEELTQKVSKEMHWIFVTEKADSEIQLSAALYRIVDGQLCGFSLLFTCLHREVCGQHEYYKRRRSGINKKKSLTKPECGVTVLTGKAE
jgi:hypothetical protein